ELQIHQDDVGPAHQELRDGVLAVAGFGHHLHVRLHVHDLRDALAHQAMVVHAQHANGPMGYCHSFFNPATACTVVPVPGTLSMRSPPPTCSARSRIVTRPKCSLSRGATVYACGSKPHPSSAIVSAICRSSY